MVPKECGFNQSKSACRFCMCLSWHFTCLPATSRDDELIKNAAFLLSRRHNWPSKLKLHNNQTVWTSTCGCNSNTIFSERTIYFHISYHRHMQCMLIWLQVSLGYVCKSRQHCWISYFSCSRFLFCLSTLSFPKFLALITSLKVVFMSLI